MSTQKTRSCIPLCAFLILFGNLFIPTSYANIVLISGSFQATEQKDGDTTTGVKIEWITATEDSAVFYVRRSDTADLTTASTGLSASEIDKESFAQVAPMGTTISGYDYGLDDIIDTDATEDGNTYYYQLIEIDNDGKAVVAATTDITMGGESTSADGSNISFDEEEETVIITPRATATPVSISRRATSTPLPTNDNIENESTPTPTPTPTSMPINESEEIKEDSIIEPIGESTIANDNKVYLPIIFTGK